MTILRTLILVGALLIAPTPLYAEDAHHPAGDTSGATADPMTPTGQPGAMAPGMMGSGMMEMMSQMSQMSPMMDPKHVEGRIVFLQTELKITEAQLPLWNAFAKVMRANAHARGEMMLKMQKEMMQTQIPAQDAFLQKLGRREQMMSAHLEELRQMKSTLTPLYGALDEAQKRTATELLMPHGMGPM